MAIHQSAVDLNDAISRGDMLSANKQVRVLGQRGNSAQAGGSRRSRPMTAKVHTN